MDSFILGKLIWAQPKPVPNNERPSWESVKDDIARGFNGSNEDKKTLLTLATERNLFGIGKYTTPLQPNTGRSSAVDAIQEALDLCVYLRNLLTERGNLPVDLELLYEFLWECIITLVEIETGKR